MAKMYYEKKRGFKYAIIFLIPGLVLLTVFMIVPFFSAFYLSFTNTRLIARMPARFIGLTNYEKILNDDMFWKGLKNIFVFVAVVVPIQTALALSLALLVNQKLKLTRFFRTVYFLPTVTTMVVVSVIWTFLYNPEGLFNSFLTTFTFGAWEPVDFINNPNWAFPAIMLLSIWQGVGFQMLIFLAGLQEIPVTLYEAATIDGANKWKQFWKITLPQLKNTSVFVIISTTILAFRLFTQVKVMTNGGPNGATYTVVLHIFNQGYQRQYIGYASAITVVFFLIVLGISILQRAVLGEEREVG
ncbi:MAG: sugar ABC transporter permease [Kosmotoga sp.]|nr:MAG: sugar ABC transporter permease [Kosmotoga sp.]